MAILFELSESVVKQAALIAAKFPDRTMLSVVEECFNYGAKSLYTDAPKPMLPTKRLVQECFNVPVPEKKIEVVQEAINGVVDQAQEKAEELDSFAEEEEANLYTELNLNSNGEFEM